ncbi:hypothetical protein [Thermosulfurimonas sp. F29]|uniref:Tc toxin subunit A-related protein n=1 Tax=Thermosulfurimonas sp. F29 TaxID=2867247 RepID=UPI001C82BD35|nr:hypothetical protein [Thermosulfurimonas sp. F29]MBX6421972.1 hypothetical protein [Thermosulfurimonas sp. F29]
MSSKNFHNNLLVAPILGAPKLEKSTEAKKVWKCQFYLHQHPYVRKLIQRLIRGGVKGLLDADTDFERDKDGKILWLRNGDPRPKLYEEFFKEDYGPNEKVVKKPYPVKNLDFSTGGAYSVYNWELFYHVPFLIAVHLSKNQRFAEAQKWFHYIFDPTDDSDDESPQRFWKVYPFWQKRNQPKGIVKVLTDLSKGRDSENTVKSIEAWRENPFRPHLIARFRQWAYMYKTVMAYLDNLIAWGDFLFRQDTPESVDEAVQIYVMAANILGPKPQPVPRKGTVTPKTYASLQKEMDEFSNALVELEADIPFVFFSPQDKATATSSTTVKNIAKTLYFCIPPNEKLLGYWDTVADRLFKIRNSLDIMGRFRRLPLFSPPIDPALLARAAAAGLNVGAIISGLDQPLPLVRFSFLVQKALEIAQEVKSLGSQLLSAMEKEDAEAMAILRAKHERAVLEMVEQVKYNQLQEAIKSREALEKSLALALARYIYYERQLGRKENEIIEQLQDVIKAFGELDKQKLENMEYSQEEPEIEPREIEVDIARDIAGRSGKTVISSYEAKELELLDAAQGLQDFAAVNETLSSVFALLPTFGILTAPFGAGAKAKVAGGEQLSKMASAVAAAFRGIAGRLSFEATMAAKIGSYARREQEWAFQSNLAAAEINQILKQLRAAQIREAIAEQELKTHRLQMKHAEEIERFLNPEGTEEYGKKTNKALYAWMKREAKGLYARAFQMAFDVAKKAERALQHELGDTNLSFIKYDYLAGKEGLLAGEKLYLDIKRMEMAYHENNRREYELTKHVSLREVDPLALIQLRETGRCIVKLPEELFDMDGPGHYFRRIKTVAVTIPCVTGPYTGINCKLTLLKSSIRKSPAIDPEYTRQGPEDPRFSDFLGSLESVVASSAQNDSGLFETNLHDQRYLPFENSGVISEWMIELPANPSADEPAQFDYSTITDVILHIRYTARDGGESLRNAAMENLKNKIQEGTAPGCTRLFDIRHEFPSEWARFISPQSKTNGCYELSLNLKEEHYPFWSKGKLGSVKRAYMIAKMEENDQITIYPNDSCTEGDNLEKDPSLGKLLIGELDKVKPESPLGEWKVYFSTNRLEDLWILIGWSTTKS